MILQIRKATQRQKPILKRLLQLYLYDFTEYESRDIGADGLFDYEYFDSYFSDDDRFPFLIYVDYHLAGFVLVNSHTCLPENDSAKSIAEFFIMRNYRRQGIGRQVAFQIFDKFPGKWEVHETKHNLPAHAFWRTAIGEYTNGNFTETDLDNDDWQGPVQSFDNSQRVKR